MPARRAPGLSEVCPLKELPQVEYVYICGEKDDAIRPEGDRYVARECRGCCNEGTMTARALSRDGHYRPFPWGTGCPLLVEANIGVLEASRVLTHQRHWLCTAAIVLMPVSAPIKVLV
jgi:hypothetical protein